MKFKYGSMRVLIPMYFGTSVEEIQSVRITGRYLTIIKIEN
jgi:hypothetical protein